jgi:pyruvate dehydrogenase E2 component (dihydrolipoamide acetyltransferase)
VDADETRGEHGSRATLEAHAVTIQVSMPQMGESIAEGTLVKWHKKVGEKVKRDETLFEISTDKVDTEIPSPQDGYLVEVLVNEGETVPVKTVVCVLGESPPGAAGGKVSGPEAKSARPEPPRGQPASTPSPVAPKSGSPQAPAGGATTGAAVGSRLREKSSPVVRRLAEEHGIDITRMTGSGLSGRVTKEDILEEIASQRSDRGGAAVEALAPPLEERVEPLSVMRQRIAEHMVLSRRVSAHVSSIFEVDMTAVRALKDRPAPERGSRAGLKLTYMPFILQAVARGLRRFPQLNASIEGKNVHYHGQINVGIAVALDDGLIVPVIHSVDSQELYSLARAVGDLAQRARTKQLKPEEVQGGTFTITNPGVFGSLIGTPIINQPQVGILCVGAVTKRPVVLPGTDAIAVRSMAYFSLSFDHRLVDGAVADRFLAEVKAQLEAARLEE